MIFFSVAALHTKTFQLPRLATHSSQSATNLPSLSISHCTHSSVCAYFLFLSFFLVTEKENLFLEKVARVERKKMLSSSRCALPQSRPSQRAVMFTLCVFIWFVSLGEGEKGENFPFFLREFFNFLVDAFSFACTMLARRRSVLVVFPPPSFFLDRFSLPLQA